MDVEDVEDVKDVEDVGDVKVETASGLIKRICANNLFCYIRPSKPSPKVKRGGFRLV